MTVDCFILQTELDARKRPATRGTQLINVNLKDDTGLTPLLVAVIEKRNENIEILLGLEGIDVNIAGRVSE
jgi:ankyrin repeat protein